jgi:competence protein ComEC
MNSYPIIKVAIFFSGGILFYKLADISSSAVIIFIVSLLMFTLFLFRISKTVASVFILFAVFFSGYLIVRNSEKDTYFFPQEVYRVKGLTVYGRITDIKLVKQMDLTFNFETDSLKTEARVVRKNVKLLCRLRETCKKRLDSVYYMLEPGNYLKLTGTYYKGREIRNPGEFDYNKYLNSLGISGTLNITGAKNINLLSDESDFFKSAIFSIRKFLDSEIKSLHNEQTSSLLKGLLLADRSEIDYVTKTQFINAGVIHVLAVSGLHVGFIAIIFLFLFGRLNIYLRSILTITGLLLFMLITGMPPSVFRATLMAVVIIIAFLFNRSTNLFNSLALAALIILVINPDELFNPGFQLSFSAVIGIALLYSPFEKFINKLRLNSRVLRYIILFMAVSLSAQIGTLPFTLTYFGKLSVIALIANLFVIPIIAIIVGLGIFTLIINSFLPFIGIYFAAANDLVTKILFLIVKISGNADFSYISVRNFSLYDSLLFYTFLLFLLYSLKSINRNAVKFAVLILVGLNFFFLSSLDNSDLFKDGKLSVFAIDVGQGDAILVKFPEGTTALIDAGNVTPSFDNGERVILRLLEYLGIEKIDYGFVSHIDSDHYAGFVSLVNAGVVKKIFKPEIDSTLVKDMKFEKYLREESVPIEYYKRGILKIDGVRIYVLNNESISKNQEFSTNNKSGVLKIVYGRTSFLFTGDIERKVEKIYASNYKTFLDADVLKAAHHGSNTSSSSAFLNYVTPEMSIISAGILNKFKHPSEEVVKRLENFGSEIYRTDKYGALIFESDGESISFIDWKKQN